MPHRGQKPLARDGQPQRDRAVAGSRRKIPPAGRIPAAVDGGAVRKPRALHEAVPPHSDGAVRGARHERLPVGRELHVADNAGVAQQHAHDAHGLQRPHADGLVARRRQQDAVVPGGAASHHGSSVPVQHCNLTAALHVKHSQCAVPRCCDDEKLALIVGSWRRLLLLMLLLLLWWW